MSKRLTTSSQQVLERDCQTSYSVDQHPIPNVARGWASVLAFLRIGRKASALSQKSRHRCMLFSNHISSSLQTLKSHFSSQCHCSVLTWPQPHVPLGQQDKLCSPSVHCKHKPGMGSRMRSRDLPHYATMTPSTTIVL